MFGNTLIFTLTRTSIAFFWTSHDREEDTLEPGVAPSLHAGWAVP